MAHDPSLRTHRGVYGISVAAELSGLDPQTLRLYERRGLLRPARTAGGTRRYSDNDLEVVQRIVELVASGVNIAGIARILELESANAALRDDNTRLRAALSGESPSRAARSRTSPTRSAGEKCAPGRPEARPAAREPG
ncbi:MerR family transcriptional regulator [Rhodococcus sp. CH91]|uniref:MerR family transcriptional regulator n=1 Tax=Rhodococcus sp. CH91 TaxID=2910256 RepID=UPI001F4AA8A8|nr:helix-turn-helix transcriptional regulator [Rhodococcus sp. CH91]